MRVSTVIIERTVMNPGSTSVAALEAIVRLKNAGLRVILIAEAQETTETPRDFEKFFSENERLIRQLSEMGVHPDGIVFCPHEGRVDCDCRLPSPGLLNDVMRRWHLDAQDCRFIGTTSAALRAAQTAHITAIALRTSKSVSELSPMGLPTFEDIPTATAHMLQRLESNT